jgi:hypothetical protein
MKILDQVPRYQKDINVIKKKITPEYFILYKILKILPKTLRLFDVACAEGFIVWLAQKVGMRATGVELDAGRVDRGKTHLGVDIYAGDAFRNMKRIDEADIIVVSRFFHNVGEELSHRLMKRIDKKKDYILIIKYKPGLKKETGGPREPLAIKDGLNKFLDGYDVSKKSFPQQTIVAAKGKYKKYLKQLRAEIGEG